jgi:formylmethanofuran dehydrogenase subunit C
MLLLKYHGTTTIPVEAECVTPDNLAGKSAAEVAALPVQHGNAPAPLGEFFRVEGDAADSEVVIEGDCARVKWLGAGMTRGRVTVRGNVGMHLGSEMRGGRIHVRGDAYRGSRLGMRGGAILVEGKAGNEVGATMRRGLIAVGGAAGDFPGVSLIAGSIFLFGPGGRPGAGMKRGTLAFLGPQPPLMHTFRYACTYRPVFVALYLRQLRAWGFPVAERFLGGAWRRYCGDLVALGKGEILAWQEG